MKKSELAIILMIAAASMFVAYLIANSLFSGASNKSVSVPTIQVISSNFQPPDPGVFNSNAINPTVGVSLTGSQ